VDINVVLAIKRRLFKRSSGQNHFEDHRLPLEACASRIRRCCRYRRLRPDPLGCHLRRRLSLRVHRRNPNTTNCLRVAVRWQCFIRLERLSTSRRDHTQLFGLQSICSFLSWARLRGVYKGHHLTNVALQPISKLSGFSSCMPGCVTLDGAALFLELRSIEFSERLYLDDL
jgi:hypothetical protein